MESWSQVGEPRRAGTSEPLPDAPIVLKGTNSLLAWERWAIGLWDDAKQVPSWPCFKGKRPPLRRSERTCVLRPVSPFADLQATRPLRPGRAKERSVNEAPSPCSTPALHLSRTVTRPLRPGGAIERRCIERRLGRDPASDHCSTEAAGFPSSPGRVATVRMAAADRDPGGVGDS